MRPVDYIRSSVRATRLRQAEPGSNSRSQAHNYADYVTERSLIMTCVYCSVNIFLLDTLIIK